MMSQYELDSVPQNQRRGGISLTLNWIGYVAVVVDLLVGGALGSAMPLSSAIAAIVIGNVVLMGIAATAAYLSYRQGKTFALLTEQTFGQWATAPLTTFVAFVILGWFTIQSSLFAHFIGIGLNLNSTAESVLGALLSIAMALTAYLGIDALRYLSVFAVPALAFMCVWTWLTVPGSPVPLQLGQELPLLSAITIVIGTWIVGSTTTVGDILRFAKSGKVAILGAAIGLGADLALMILGATAVHRYGTADLAQVLANSMGFIIGLVFFALNVWTTNDNAMYSASLNLSVCAKITHRKAIVFATVLAVVAVMFRPYRFEIIIHWLQFLGKAIPSIGAVVFVTTLMFPRLQKGSESRRFVLSLTALVLGTVTAFGLKAGIEPLNGFLTAAVVQAVLLYVFELRPSKQIHKAGGYRILH